MTVRFVVLISGSGTNLHASLDACASGELPTTLVAVISNKAAAYIQLCLECFRAIMRLSALSTRISIVRSTIVAS